METVIDKTSITWAIAHTCIRQFYEAAFDGKQNPTCKGCTAIENELPCPLGPARPEVNPFEGLYITKDEAIRRLEEKRAKYNWEVDERIREIKDD